MILQCIKIHAIRGFSHPMELGLVEIEETRSVVRVRKRVTRREFLAANTESGMKKEYHDVMTHRALLEN